MGSFYRPLTRSSLKSTVGIHARYFVSETDSGLFEAYVHMETTIAYVHVVKTVTYFQANKNFEQKKHFPLRH